MEYAALREAVYEANKLLPQYRLVTFTWGNVSQLDREKGVVAIKPSGVDYDKLRPEDMVVLDLQGNVVSGRLNPSSDTKTHLALYNAFPQIGGIVHTHSPNAVAWAQAGEDIPCYGTTHADYFYGSIPCARDLTQQEIDEDYEANTGAVIIETFRQRGVNPSYVPAVVCRSHGPFTWGKDAAQAVYHSVVLEEVAKMAILTRQVHGDPVSAPQRIQDKHFLRKHGPNAYYGQK
jgi:L-ribulose-5-phosphate 4-epimerase